MMLGYAPDQLDIKVPRIRCSRINAGNSDARFQEEVQGAKVKPRRTRLDMDIILPTSAKSARKAAESLAYYFKREFQYDAPPYEHLEATPGRDRIILLTHNYHDFKAALGLICFRWRE